MCFSIVGDTSKFHFNPIPIKYFQVKVSVGLSTIISTYESHVVICLLLSNFITINHSK